MDQLGIQNKNIKGWTQEERNGMMQSYQEIFDSLANHVEKAKAKGKIVFVKEHSNFLR